MKVCSKCGWQNEDGEAKCFQCYADLLTQTANPVPEPETPPETEPDVTPEEAEAVETTGVWFDPDMRPIEHDTPEQIIQSGSVRFVEEETVLLEEEKGESGYRLPTWAFLVMFVVFILLAAFIGKALACEPDPLPALGMLTYN